MTVPATQFNSVNGYESYKSLHFQLVDGSDGKTGHFPVVVKNLTTVGVILEILQLDNGYNSESLKGVKGFLKIIAQDDCLMAEVPGRILWTRHREGEAGATMGLELLEPLPLPVRQMLEANMAISSKDLKVLWDYWDEIKETATPPKLPQPASPVPVALDHAEISGEQLHPNTRSQSMYWVGFGAMMSGFAMQFSQSEYLCLSGLAVIFFGSLLVAFKSILSFWQISSPGPFDQDGLEEKINRKSARA